MHISCEWFQLYVYENAFTHEVSLIFEEHEMTKNNFEKITKFYWQNIKQVKKIQINRQHISPETLVNLMHCCFNISNAGDQKYGYALFEYIEVDGLLFMYEPFYSVNKTNLSHAYSTIYLSKNHFKDAQKQKCLFQQNSINKCCNVENVIKWVKVSFCLALYWKILMDYSELLISLMQYKLQSTVKMINLLKRFQNLHQNVRETILFI